MSEEREGVWSQVHKECNVRLFRKDEELIWRLIAHELAEKIRANCHLKPGQCGCHTAAKLIDPEVIGGTPDAG